MHPPWDLLKDKHFQLKKTKIPEKDALGWFIQKSHEHSQIMF